MDSHSQIVFQFDEYCARGLSEFKSYIEALTSAYIINILALKCLYKITNRLCILLGLYNWNGNPGHLVCYVCNSDMYSLLIELS